MPKRVVQRDIKNKDLLQKRRDRFKYMLEKWKPIHDEFDTNMRFRAGDQWTEKEKKRREKSNMPMFVQDELTQYVNQVTNDLRQNKNAVNVLPKGAGANDQSASNRADWIRGVEYLSQGQTAYIQAVECAAWGNHGWWKLETYYDGPSFELNVRIVPIPNPKNVVMDPDCIQYDCSDAADAFEFTWMSEDSFKRRWPNAEIQTFAEDVQSIAPDWLKPQQVQVASYWRVELEKVQLHKVDLGGGQHKIMFGDELPEKFDEKRILKTRDYERRRIVQEILNGIEILETNDPKKGKGWPGQWIPLIGVFGEEFFVDYGSGSERRLFSLISRARDPQRKLNYFASQELAEAKLTPRTPLMGPVGMFSSNKAQWENLNEDPMAFIEYGLPEGYLPGQIKPERVPFQPNFQAYEIAMESASRSIMKAMGINPLPLQAQKANEKSGIAIERIQNQSQIGSSHIVDNFRRSLVFCGRQLDDVYDRIIVEPRDIPFRSEDGKHRLGRVNDTGNNKSKKMDGDHDVTITTGPSYESQREEAAAFADTLAQVQGVFPLIGDLLVRLRNLGPIGEKIAERLTPPQFAGQDEDIPPTAQAAIAAAQKQVQDMQAVIVQLQQEKAAKMVEKDSAYRIAALQENTKLVIAQAGLQRDQAEAILQAELKKIQQILQMAHDAGMAAQDNANTVAQNEQTHQQTLEQGDQAHAHAKDQAAQGHTQAMEQATQAASLAPEPQKGGSNGKS